MVITYNVLYIQYHVERFLLHLSVCYISTIELYPMLMMCYYKSNKNL